MELAKWKIVFEPGWDRHFKKFDSTAVNRILKKFESMKQPLGARGMHSSRYMVEEAGQYRIAFIQDENAREKRIHFVGNHKQYEKWYMDDL